MNQYLYLFLNLASISYPSAQNLGFTCRYVEKPKSHLVIHTNRGI
jgi:hypothetical protein